MSFSTIQFDHSAGVARITLNRPERLNALCPEMFPELQAALDRGQAEGMRALVITGAGRGFCAGADLTAPLVAGQEGREDIGLTLELYYNPLMERLRALPVPVIAAVNGVAAGAGASLALAADITVAAESASFVLAFARIGLIPDGGATQLIAERIGLARALGLSLLGEKVGAAEAAQWGLVWKCVPDAALKDTVDRMAQQLAQGPTVGLGLTKRAVYAAARHSLAEQLALERRLQSEAGRTDDFAEGVAAFLAKRPARFTGH